MDLELTARKELLDSLLSIMVTPNLKESSHSDTDDNKYKDANLKIINILGKKFLMNINKINLILVYFVSVSSINIMHLLELLNWDVMHLYSLL